MEERQIFILIIYSKAGIAAAGSTELYPKQVQVPWVSSYLEIYNA